MTCFCCLLWHKGLSLPLLTGKLTSLTGRASSLLNGSVGVVGVSEERESALPILAKGDNVLGTELTALLLCTINGWEIFVANFGIIPYMGEKRQLALEIINLKMCSKTDLYVVTQNKISIHVGFKMSYYYWVWS